MAINVPNIPKHKEENVFNYTEDELGERKRALKVMQETWPDVPKLYAEWVYDLCKCTKAEELQEIMRKVDSEPSKYKAEGGVSHACEVIGAEQSLEHQQAEIK